MTYEIWDTTSRNLLARFDRYGEALDFLRDQIARLGTSWVDGITLFEIADRGRSRQLVAEDRSLLPLLRVRAGSPA
jgi:hypothetical protein